MDSTRLRKAFKYPPDDDGDGSQEAMDEEEQEHLLQNLQASETSTNEIYTTVFTCLPLVIVLPFLWYLFRSTSGTMVLLCLLGITSLVSSAYIMYMVPVSTTLGSLSNLTRIARRDYSGSRTSFLLTSDQSPINQYLPYLNAFICALLFLASWGYLSRSDVPEGLWLFLLLPGLIFGMVFMAKRSMAEIETGLSELRGMRYQYKGA
ncbi:hypothetical protein A1O7_06051 [Cladophialophora yegresii CBS 114405]|uniref:Uncharacterized protein n=1 Tax=Cladophialophora yegresii CBS 114405 TaxID=1182544 RepID=W9WJF3_9EURO|nr:uncharacterized protein A1O7_06051 [Cladophialophora yegresii CBS 114405]EXJ58624.1 hypothetical protein A1O7_06051 [Cladophialophora yegresii CBS 114405]